MASSNRHWPSMFKSKPTHHQWQHDVINPSIVPNGSCHRPPYTTTTATTSSGIEDQRTPEPKPRWNPRPEQIRILEAIFNSGMVNPPRDEIRKIRAQLQEYGQVGDANVFYWFQNRKSRSKHKLRLQHINSKQQQQSHKPSLTAAPSSSSSSSERSSPNKQQQQSNKAFSMGFSSPPHVVTTHDVSNINSPTASVNQTSFFHALPNPEVLPESAYFFPVNNPSSTNGPVASGSFSTTQGFCFSELANVVHVNNSPDLHGPCTSLLLSEIMNNNGMASRKNGQDQEMKGTKMDQLQQQLNYNGAVTTSPTTTGAVNVAVPSPMTHIQGVGEAGAAIMGAGGAAKSMVFINDVAFEVAAGPFNVREAFGDDAVLIHSSGHPVLTNEWGVTLHSLHHGAFYYLI
ncbi:putative transcription factor Homobox-WOX family [Rosa chinensis]|uniref:Putative transcription factor Homobox-WOX family n=1 Tax=Rosa chinensis TaxID=74649 RepID=A0A2P6Q4E7_ROSCH|nr:WUSCHEL-related homeobox 9 [Rosa chinensis]PRQ29055.1 putative transcription factor Homobox-WOX family [Rosa chinensis]